MVRVMEPFIWHIGGAGWGRMWGEGCRQEKGGKKSKNRLTIAFFAGTAAEKVIEPLLIWRSATPHYFKNIKTREHPHGIYY